MKGFIEIYYEREFNYKKKLIQVRHIVSVESFIGDNREKCVKITLANGETIELHEGGIYNSPYENILKEIEVATWEN